MTDIRNRRETPEYLAWSIHTAINNAMPQFVAPLEEHVKSRNVACINEAIEEITSYATYMLRDLVDLSAMVRRGVIKPKDVAE
jgi:hypothetical protein